VPKNRNFANFIVYVFIIPLLGNNIHRFFYQVGCEGEASCIEFFRYVLVSAV
jgi:hypothetical protein